VLQLRRLVRAASPDPLRCDPKKILVTRPGGYQLILAQMMLALYRAGRRSEALDGYRRLHKLLSEEMGLEPPYRIRALREAILREDFSLDLDSMPEVAQLNSRQMHGI
jgi:hypothetical protein